MPTNERFMPVPPDAVWDALTDVGGYGYWVPGSRVIRDAEPGWPVPGSKFHHTLGLGPFQVGLAPVVVVEVVDGTDLSREQAVAERRVGTNPIPSSRSSRRISASMSIGMPCSRAIVRSAADWRPGPKPRCS